MVFQISQHMAIREGYLRRLSCVGHRRVRLVALRVGAALVRGVRVLSPAAPQAADRGGWDLRGQLDDVVNVVKKRYRIEE